MENIYPEFKRMLGRESKEGLLGQTGRVIWCYGISGSGKSTLANAYERDLHKRGYLTQILDGDNIRSGLNNNLGFSDEDREENIRRIAEVSKLFAQLGVITIASFICPRRQLRDLARGVVGNDDFMEVYIKASYETCAQRDPKGLYKKVAAGKVAQFTGKDSAFEEPSETSDALIIDTEAEPLDRCVQILHAAVEKKWGALPGIKR